MRIIVLGKPFGKARPRSGKFGVYNPKQNKEYEDRVRAAFKQAVGMITEPVDKPMWLSIECVYPIPKTTPKRKREMMLAGKLYPMVKPDLDNCIKSVMDALNGLAYYDDKQIVHLRAVKKYGDVPQTIIDIGRYYTHDVDSDR